jgi:hypothetical protein
MAHRGKRNILSDARHVLKTYDIGVEIDEETPAVTIRRVQYVKPTLLAQHLVELMRSANNNRRYEEWKLLPLAGRVLRSEEAIDLVTSFEWLRKGNLSSIGVRNVLSVQEGCLLTRTHPACTTIGKAECWMCSGPPETIKHIVSCCPIWLSTLYIYRHNSVARNIYYILCKQADLQPPHYSQKVDSVKENDRVKLYWNQLVQTRAIICYNKPDLIIFDRIQKKAIVIEVAVSGFTGIQKQIDLKRNRYCVNGNWDDELRFPYPRGNNIVFDLTSQGWKVTFIPIVIGATGEVLLDMKDQIKKGLGLS